MSKRAKLFNDYINQIDPATFEQFAAEMNVDNERFDQYLENKLSEVDKAQFEEAIAKDESYQFAFQLHQAMRSGVESLPFRKEAINQMNGLEATVMQEQDQRFEAYFLDKMTESERVAFETELEMNTLLALELKAFEQKWQFPNAKLKLHAVPVNKKNSTKLAIDNQAFESNKTPQIRKKWRQWLSVAAMLSLFTLGAFFVFNQMNREANFQTIVAAHYEAPNPKAVTWASTGVKAEAIPQTAAEIQVLRNVVKTQLEIQAQDDLKTILVIQNYLNQVQPQNEDYYLYVFMGNAYWQLEKYEEAMTSFKTAMDNIDEGQTGWKQDAQKYLALAYLQTNQTDKALQLVADLKDHAVGGKAVRKQFEELYQDVLTNQ